MYIYETNLQVKTSTLIINDLRVIKSNMLIQTLPSKFVVREGTVKYNIQFKPQLSPQPKFINLQNFY